MLVGPVAGQVAPNEVIDGLRGQNVYVAEAARSSLSDADRAELEAYARAHASVKLMLLDRPPRGFTSLGQFVDAAHSTLGLGDGLLMGVALDAGNGSGSVSAKTA